MKLKNSFFYTLREDLKEEESISGKLLTRSGMIKKTSSGVYMFLPLGFKVLENIKNIIREEMDNQGCNELLMPVLTNEEVFEKSGRKGTFGKDMFTLKDRFNKPYALGPTHEELFTICAGLKIRSYKDMPFNIYQFGTKFRDEMRPRFGLVRVREFIMKDAYSFDTSEEACDISYLKMKRAYSNIMDRCNIDYKIVTADGGAMSSKLSEEFQAICDVGEDIIVTCDCSFASNIEVSDVITKSLEKEEEKEIELISTPDVKTIDEICEFLNIGYDKAVKTLVYNVDGEIMMFLVKGDREVNETKIRRLLSASNVSMATPLDLATITDANFGSLGPVNIDCKIIIDNEVSYMSNFVVGANKDGYHYINTNLSDFNVYKQGDIVNVKEGDICPNCGNSLKFKRGIEVGNIFKLGDKYTRSFDLKYLDSNNKECYPIMGCYGIGVGRVLATIVEQHHDENGILWPMEVAPFKVSIVLINNDAEEYANKLYDELNSKGISVILDDRKERPGIKFNDMDLIGVPIRITIGKKFNDGYVELKLRSENESKDVMIDELVASICDMIDVK